MRLATFRRRPKRIVAKPAPGIPSRQKHSLSTIQRSNGFQGNAPRTPGSVFMAILLQAGQNEGPRIRTARLSSQQKVRRRSSSVVSKAGQAMALSGIRT
jgi:hypothetical protein